MIMNRNEVKVLKLLADGKQHDEAPEGMTYAQFSVALKSLKMKEMVYAMFEEGGGVVASLIKMKGRAALDDLLQEEREEQERLADKDTVGLTGGNERAIDEELVEELSPIFYGKREEVVKYIEKMKTISSNTEKVRYTAELANNKIISDVSCKTALWRVLNSHDLYHPGCNNWLKTIKNYLKLPKVERFQ